MAKIFLICPTRGHDPAETLSQVEKLEQRGNTVHWPPRDTSQIDLTGLQICKDNLRAIQEADCIYFTWDGISQGCLFDLGMAFALGKPIIYLSMPMPTKDKSFQNMVRAYHKESYHKEE